MNISAHRVRMRILSVAIIIAAAFGVGEVGAADGDFNLTVSTDAAVYAPGNLVSIEVIATYSDGSPVTSPGRSSVNITDSNNKRQFRSELDFHGNGAFSSTYNLRQNAPVGTWLVKVRVDLGGGNR